MSTPDNYLTYGLMCLGIGGTLLYAAITGFLDVSIVFGLQLKSTRVRVVCFVLSVPFFAVGIWMIRRLLDSVHKL
jgi:hypothetical protein